MSENIREVSKGVLYDLLAKQVRGLLENERDAVANMANVAALLFNSLAEVNWVGFYRLKHNELVLGPFMGQPACVRIAVGRGVCGTCAKKKEALVVDNVHNFSGHIACDSASNSEIVLPLIKDGRVYGVLDIDSPALARFDDNDRAGLQQIVDLFLEHTNLSGGL